MHTQLPGSGIASFGGGGTGSALHALLRGYKSLAKSMKPINSRASKLAVAPFIQGTGAGGSTSTKKQQQQQRLQRARAAQAAARLQAAPIVDSALPQDMPSLPSPPELRPVGRLTAAYSPSHLASPPPAFAVVGLQGTQFKLTVDDIVFVNHMRDVAVNEVVALERVLLLGGTATTSVGRPYVPRAAVVAAVEEHFRDGQVHVFKFKKRNRYKRYHVHRPALTALRVLHVTDDASDAALQVRVGHTCLIRVF